MANKLGEDTDVTSQLQGELLFSGWTGGSDPGDEVNWVYTPWMPVRGNIATFAVELVAIQGLTLTWDVESRTLADPSSIVSVLASPQAASSVGVFAAKSVIDALELARYKFATGAASSLDEFVVVRSLVPSWQLDT